MHKEKELLFRLKSELFDQFTIPQGELHIDEYLQILTNIFRDFLSTEKVHFILHKELFLKNQHLFNVLTNEKISYFEDWQADYYFTSTALTDRHFSDNSFQKQLLLKNEQDQLRGVILLESSTSNPNPSFSERFWESCAKICYQYLQNAIRLLSIDFARKRMQTLQQVTNNLYTTMDMDEIFSQMFRSLTDIYPYFLYRIFVSSDEMKESEFPLYMLDFTKVDSPELKVFMTGEKKLVSNESLAYHFLYLPLKGKQGIYGVLEVGAKDADMFGSEDVQFMTRVTSVASRAIENAHLYYQSKRLVNNLRIVTKVSRHLNAKLRLSEVGAYFIEELKRSLNAGGVAIVLNHDGNLKVFETSSPFFFTINGKGFLKYLATLYQKGKDSIFVGDIQRDSAKSYGVRSVMSEPLKQNGKIFGFIVVVDERPYHFSFETFKLFQSLSHHAALALANARLRDELEKLVITDYLTKLFTRSYLDGKMQESLENDEQGAFVLIDIDNFKRINDLYGHQVGDEVLQQIADIIRRHLHVNDIAARWGGEEIAVYLPNRTLEDGLELANQLIEEIQKETEPEVTISCGVSCWNQNRKDNPRSLFVRADQALYKAKEQGKNKVVAETRH